VGPVAPHHLRGIVEVDVLLFQLGGHEGEGQGPLGVRLDRFDELGSHQQGEVELAQAAVLALGADEVEDVRMAHVEGGHLRPAAATGGRDGETHLVVDVHEGQGPGGIGPGPGDVGAARAEGGELIPDATVVDHHQAVVARQVIVVFLDGEVVEGFGQLQIAPDAFHGTQGADEADDLAQVGETRLPTVQPDAADHRGAVIAMVEPQRLALRMAQPSLFGFQGITQCPGHDIAVVLARLTGMPADAFPLAAVGHVTRNLPKEG